MTEHNQDQEKEYITIIDEDNNEALYEILLTFESDEYQKSYVIVFPAGELDEDHEDEDIELQAFSFIENEDGDSGDLQSIESEEEWEMVEEVLDTFFEEEDL